MVKETKKSTKLKEDALVTETQPQEMPAAQQATPEEVNAATAAVTPQEPVAAEDEVPTATAEDPISTPQEPITPNDPLIPPVPGMIPSGWVKPEDLASALAQETGDAEVAATAEDAMVTDQPVPTDSAINQSVEPQENPSVVPTEEEQEVILEYRKYKANLGKKLVEAEDEDPITGNSLEDLNSDDVEEEVVEVVEPEDEDENSDEDVLDVIEDDADIFEDGEEGLEINEDLMDTINNFLTELGDDEEETDPVNTLKATADFLDDFADDMEDLNLDADEDDEAEDEAEDDEVEDLEDTDVEEVVEDTETEEPTEDEDEEVVEEEEEDYFESRVRDYLNSRKPLKEGTGIIYPAGSEPGANTEISSSIKDSSKENLRPDSNLVRSYEKTAAAKRRALKEYRENLLREDTTKRRPSNPKFREALNSTARISEKEDKSAKKDSWSSNKFLEKYEESKSFSFQQLLEDGFLG